MYVYLTLIWFLIQKVNWYYPSSDYYIVLDLSLDHSQLFSIAQGKKLDGAGDEVDTSFIYFTIWNPLLIWNNEKQCSTYVITTE